MLRSKLPSDLNTSVVVGKWYVPFIFVKERDAKVQIKRSTYYSMTLRKSWEEVYSCGKVDYNEEHGEGEGEVEVDVEVESELVKLEGQVIQKETRGVDENGVAWFEIAGRKIGLRSMVVEKMKSEEERFGWSKETDDIKSSIKRSHRFEGTAMLWQSYKCYVLVETFELKRMDGSLVLTYEFRHADMLKTKWD
ncbi:hypothetical protein Bca52824_034307 [Brassica carinata]|uniref:Uncharacterized protein n=1 Tax=Brassica carinata TaxID=52824 RepID=A0A8X7S2Y6_BRACI|nr:hypothetical protein Bca52824_034307 [Brassica carinata]